MHTGDESYRGLLPRIFEYLFVQIAQERAKVTSERLADPYHYTTAPTGDHARINHFPFFFFSRSPSWPELTLACAVFLQSVDIEVEVSFLEIYQERVFDLLTELPTPLTVHEDARKGTFVENLTSVKMNDVAECCQALSFGQERRRVGETQMNDKSSRSHSVFTLYITAKVSSHLKLCQFTCAIIRVSAEWKSARLTD